MLIGCGASAADSERPATIPQRVDVVAEEPVSDAPRVVPRRITSTEGDEAVTTAVADRESVPPPPVEPPTF